MSVFAEFSVINYFPCEKGFFTPPRVFDYPYLLYVHGGKGEYKIGNRRHRCEKGDLLFCRPGEENTIFADKEDPFVLSGLEFTVEDEKKLEQMLPEKLNLRGQDFAEACIGKMIEEALYDRICGREICTHLLNALLLELFRTAQGDPGREKPDAREILNYIAAHLGRKIPVRELSETFHYHRNTVNRLVKEATGLSVGAYIQSLRLREAKKLLRFTRKSVEEIAFLTGYSSAAFFCLQFKEKTGLTPARFRRGGPEL